MKHSFFIALFLIVNNFYSQKKEMTHVVSNYNSFSTNNLNSIENWKLKNKPEFFNHPEFGKLPSNAPCYDCVEDISKRTENEKFFVSTNNPSEFYQQKSYGALHFLEDGKWLTIDERLSKKIDHIYSADKQVDPTGINTQLKNSFIKTPFGTIQFNQWKLIGIKNNIKVDIANSNWSDYTIGENGIHINNIFQGIDLELKFSRGSIKSNFIIRENNFAEYESLLFEDVFTSNSDGFLRFTNSETSKRGVGELTYKNNFESILEIGMALIYPQGYEKEKSQYAEYIIENNKIGILIPMIWIIENLKNNTRLIIDPTVTSANTLAQASITGSGYNATCFNGFCSYNLSVPTPANATVTDVQWSFNYRAQSTCYMQEGAVTFQLGTCRSPSSTALFWFCDLASGGDCTGSNISMFSDISTCLPAPSCSPQNLNFTMRFHRCWSTETGCSNTCIGAISPWTMTIIGRTLEYTNATPITLNNTTICQGGTINASTAAVFGVPPYNYNWSLNSNMIPSNGSGVSSTFNFPNSGTYTIYSTVTDACGTLVNSSRTVTVNPSPSLTINPNPQTICSGLGTGLTLTSNLTNTSYSWSTSMSGVTGATNSSGTGTGSNSSLSLNQTLTNSGTTPGTATYTITPSASSCPGSPVTVIVTVNPTPTVTIPGNQTICAGQSSTAINFTGTAGATFGWINNNVTTGLGAFGIGNIPSFVGLNSGATNNVSTVSVTPTYGICPGAQQNFTITVTPPPTVTAPSSQTICAGASTTAITFTGTATTYNWTNSNTAIGLGVNGTGNIASFVGTNTGTTPISGTITVTPVSGTCSGTPQTFTITINPIPTVTQPQNQTLCAGQNTSAITFSGTAGSTYTWSNNNTAIGLGANGTGNIAAFTATNSTSNSISSTVTVTPTIGSCPGAPVAFTITVAVTPTVTAPTSQTICAGASTTAITFTGTATTYNWTNSNTAIGLGANGTGNIPSFIGTNTGSTPISGTITVTPVSGTCSGTPQTFTITINPIPSVTQPQNQTLCAGQNTSAINFSGTAGSTYTWSNNNTATGLGANGTGNIATFTATNSTSNSISSTVTVTPTIGSCPGNPVSFTITVAITPTVTAPTSQTICAGDSTTAITFSGTAATYNWTNSNTAIGLGANGTGNIPSFLGTNTGSTPISGAITVTPVSGTCSGTTQTFTITVNPTPTVTQTQNQTLCAGQNTSAITFSGTAGSTYTWSNNNTATGLGANGTGNIATFTATNSTSNSISSTVTVTPTIGSCPGTPVTFTITVAITPTVTAPTSQTICAGASTTAITFTGTATTYNWTNSNTAIGLGVNGTGNIASFVGTNTGSTPISGTITVTPVSGTCSGTPQTFTITINPTPTVSQPQNQTLCAGQSTSAITFSGTAGSTYTWSNNNTATGLGANGTGNIAAFTATNTTSNSISSTVTVTPTIGSCPGTPVTFTITVAITPTVTAPTSQTICASASTTAITFTGAATTYNWTNSNTAIGLGANGTGNIPSFVGSNTGTTPISGTITVTPTSGTCLGIVQSFTITINPSVTPTFTQLGPYCQNQTPGVLTTTSNNSIAGTWNPSTISTTTNGSQTYTFTPNVGLCAVNTIMNIVVNSTITPTFTQLGPFCQNIAAAALPTTSSNTPSISGTWNPTTVSTATVGNIIYTFTPNPNQCAITSTMTISTILNPTINLTPQTICSGQSLTITPTVNATGGSYLWSNNQTTSSISVSPVTTTSYSLSYSLSGCNTNGTVLITVNPTLTPAFTQLGPYCQNQTPGILSPTSNNSINGTWNPTSISTTTPGNQTYTFTPAAGVCATSYSQTILVNPIVNPTFNPIGPLCQNEANPALPIGSTNNPSITGTWNPASISTSTIGNTNYTFTPATSSQCASTANLTVTIIASPTPTINASVIGGCSPLSTILSTQLIPNATYTWTSNGVNIGTGASLNSVFSNAGCYDITLSVSLGSCQSSVTTNDLICVEAPPNVSFTVNPNSFTNSSEIVNFSNNTTGATSYSWDFGDGQTSILENPSHVYTGISSNILAILTASSPLGCTSSFSVVISYIDETVFYVPNTFTPDEDEFNQTWGPVFTKGFDAFNFNLYIYNRWGEIIWESKDANARWDGSYGTSGLKCPQGVYTWRIDYKPIETDEKLTITGQVNLLR
jgi:gliding motility-associated-like protein